MTHKFRWSALAGLMALLSASAVACGDDEAEDTTPPSRCDSVVCDENETCDPDDGACYCGGAGGVACLEGQRCELLPSPSCVADLCDFVVCDSGQSCDPTDGACKCGNVACGEGEVCVNNACQAGDLCDGVQCGAGESCDVTDGICKCGTGENAALCSFGETCVDGGCEEDACAGVNCGPGTVCSDDDGLCHCGTAEGSICAQGQACEDDGTGTFACNGPDVCADAATRCTGGTVCDPLDGECRCGGVGPTAAICGPGQTCDVPTGRCLGGDQCLGVNCTNGTSCDPEDGQCKCGGLGGDACATEEVCVEIAGAATCTAPCDPNDQDACGDGFGCFYDASQRLIGPFCAPVEDNAPLDGSTCTSATDCDAGLHCLAGTDANRCRPYCNENDTSGTPCEDTSRICGQISGAPDGVGVCVIVQT
jgi:hypothetical protein